jgi:hypothetical protein
MGTPALSCSTPPPAQQRGIVARGDVAQDAGLGLEHPEEGRQELARDRVALEVSVDPRHEVRDGARLVDLEVHGGVDRRHEERRRNALARDVGHEEREPSAGEREEVEVVAADLAGRDVARGDVEPRDTREVAGQDLPLDRRGELELPLDALFLKGLLVQTRRFDRGRRLVGEERQQARVGRREVQHAAVPRFLVRDRQDPEPPAGDRDLDREHLLARERGGRRVARGGGVVDQPAVGQLPGRGLARTRLADAARAAWPASTSVPLPASVSEIERNSTRRPAPTGRAGRPERPRS